MKIGTLGAGLVAQSFALKAMAAGHEIVFSNRRGPETLTGLVGEFGPQAHAATLEEAARQEIVLLAVPWANVEDTLNSLPAWHGQILIDATNALTEGGAEDFGQDSSSEMIARLAPGARVVKAMNAMFMENFRKDPVIGDLRRAMFISGNDRSAASDVADLFEDLGFAPVLLGSLARGGRMQAVGATLAGHDLFLPWPAPRSFPAFNGEPAEETA
ncbi:NAD(P)-binding domain-containing protein [uncultured Roseibium sp.]|uniref:NADPH-dependent F420 reductase n=1 Tax=uncultured Roseibium sp. TaxID=1936171 RepID=UPI00262246F4|nr:NAD(P)-binding domain-containing protein [uncultured Roseibium sp.]